MKRICLYFHAGSINHGCEAIVRGTNKIITFCPKILYSFNKKEDIEFGVDSIIDIKQAIVFWNHKKNNIKKISKLKTFIQNKIPRCIIKLIKIFILNKKYKDIISDKSNVFLSIGGDNYCYQGYENLIYINKKLCELDKKTVLWGCSIEPKNIKKDISLQKDLRKYSLIIARESLTYDALIENGITKNTHLFPDPAFLLDKEIPIDLPNNFIPYNTVGLNLSPILQDLEKINNITYKNFVELFKYIIDNTNMNISLIPHVFSDFSNDLEPLTKLYNQFKNTNRVCLIDKHYNACQLKGIISQCRFMIAARTHASIAAYSAQIPTLVIGYSVKSKGIAKDIFGDYKDYVLPIQELKEKTEILEVFKNLIRNEYEIKEYYKNFMPSYIERTWLAGKEVEKLLNN